MAQLDLIIVDDDKFMGKVFSSMLSGYEINYEFYSDSTEALSAILEHRPKCVLLDYNMPGMNGQDLIVKLSENHIFQHSSIFLITADALSEMDKMRMMTLGFEKLIDKNVLKKETFLEAISDVLGEIKKLVA
ncbi:response regulator [Halobacteriovorax sp. GB3]|uniref:response regulator n=1 Tax=Halobacteriovorax sp. GB3 TaxID=2719615 RepID=UPI00235F7A10|nr:response regulator [Halobacteriovorax sp. GB3]MDD0852857.1 response regulator [Halobacteriovorax sp. GB3]